MPISQGRNRCDSSKRSPVQIPAQEHFLGEVLGVGRLGQTRAEIAVDRPLVFGNALPGRASPASPAAGPAPVSDISCRVVKRQLRTRIGCQVLTPAVSAGQSFSKACSVRPSRM